MMRLRPAHWALAFVVAGGMHFLLLAGVPDPRSAVDEGDGTRTVTLELGAAQPAPMPPAAAPAAEATAAEAPAGEATPAPVPERKPATSPQPSKEKPGENARQSVDRHSAISGKDSQTPEKESHSPSHAAGAAKTQESDERSLEPYFGELRQWLAEHRRYPRRARMRRLEGVAILEIELAADGQPRASRIVAGSGHALLDRAVREMVERAQPLPPPPADLDVAGRIITVPVDFSLR